MRSATWITFRAVLALTLLVGFYLLGVSIAILLLLVPYAEFAYLGQAIRVSPRFFLGIAAVCIGAAGAILWALVPRLDKFEPPGVQLTVETQPRLFAVLNDVAAAMRQKMPSEVYLVGDVNAWVTHRGGVMGFGSRRVMGLGLPLLQLVSVKELKAILAHEFGHYSSGDVVLGPWIYKTRGAIARTLEGLAGTGFDSMFTGYWRMFLRVSSAVSRHQEFSADQLAAGAMGAGPLISGLRKASVAGHAFVPYATTELRPVLAAGYAPSLVEGFSVFLQQPAFSAALAGRDDSLLSDARVDPYDSHPPFADRVTALNAAVVPHVTEPFEPAISLLVAASSLELALVGRDLAPDQTQALRPVPWPAVASVVYLPVWRDILERHAPRLGGVNIESLPTTVGDAIPFARGLTRADEGYVPGDELARRLAWVAGAAACIALVRQGWKLQTAPGFGFWISNGEGVARPLSHAQDVVFGRVDLAGWRSFCADVGLCGPIRDLIVGSRPGGAGPGSRKHEASANNPLS